MATLSKKKREQVDTERRGWVAEALADGSDDATIVARLIERGVPPSQAKRELQLAQRDPLFAAARKISQRLSSTVTKRDWTLDIYSRLAANNPESLEIPTVNAIKPERFFREYYFANRPVKLTGLVDHWPALKKWSLDYFEQKLGDATVEVQVNRSQAKSYESEKDPHRRHAMLKDVLALLRRDEPSNDYYITAYNDTTNKQTLAPLWEDLGDLSILQPSGGNDGFFWLGPAGTLTPFHHDLTNNLLVQIEGRKLVQMVPSWEVARMRNSQHCFSDREPIDFSRDDPDLPPRLVCTIGKGEAIFLPIGWWHHVTALDRSISMSFTNFDADNDFLEGYPNDTNF
ncbi:MAG: cupin-like domain-containing protein [Pseudomonadota bacterium]